MQIYYIYEKKITYVALEGNIANYFCDILNVEVCTQGLIRCALLYLLILPL